MSSNEGRAVQVCKRVFGEPKEVIGNGTFICFGIDYDEFEAGAAAYTTAIVELSNGEVVSVRVENIKFLGAGLGRVESDSTKQVSGMKK